MPIHTIGHPLVLHKLTYMRQNTKDCPSRLFVRLMKEIGMIMGAEVMREIYKASERKEIVGPNGIEFSGEVLEGKKPTIVPILRSGLIMAEGMQEIIATNFTGHIGIYHDEASDQTVQYLAALPENKDNRYFFLVDPVIATGATACLAISTLKEYRVTPDKIVFISLIVGLDGQNKIEAEHPDIMLFGVKFGEEVAGKRVVRGLGSVSDRQFRTI